MPAAHNESVEMRFHKACGFSHATTLVPSRQRRCRCSAAAPINKRIVCRGVNKGTDLKPGAGTMLTTIRNPKTAGSMLLQLVDLSGNVVVDGSGRLAGAI